MGQKAGSWFEWRDAAAYAPLLEADRSLFAWEWLRRDRNYRAAVKAALEPAGKSRASPDAAAFGLVAFEDPRLGVPNARPMWRAGVHPLVLQVERCSGSRADDRFDLRRMSRLATFVAGEGDEHLLLSDGLRAIRLDGPRATFSAGPACLHYLLEGLVSAEPGLRTLQRFLALCRNGQFSRLLHPREPRARRWIMMLRAWDALAAGAGQREIASELLSRSVTDPRWRSRQSSLRSQAQRLVRSAREYGSAGYRALLSDGGTSRRIS